jgi:nicotinate phosphoribosyltransferase
MNHHSPLLTDLYQLTMAAGYWHHGRTSEEAVFHLFFRKPPFGGSYAIAAGLADVIDFLHGFQFSPQDLAYLATLTGSSDEPLFAPAFLDYLGALRFTGDLDAMPEGTAAFAHEPLLRIRAPLPEAQLLESALLNSVNFQTLIATKASRICRAASPHPVLEFGLRRAPGPDGALSASRAAFIGGCAATSHVLAGQRFGIPVRGTHAHSWVMSFDSEPEAFAAYAEAMPGNCTLLVDTYDSLDGIRHAIATGLALRRQGHRLAGIRLDSGDLAWLSQQARQMLDAAGLHDTAIVASNDLDEEIIASLRQQQAAITVWGVGTQLVTGGAHAALGGVYKLGAIRNPDGSWSPKVKRSEQAAKTSLPGILQVRRFSQHDHFVGDAIFDLTDGCPHAPVIRDPADPTRTKSIPAEATYDDLLVPVFRGGEPVYQSPALTEIKARTTSQLAQLSPESLRFLHPHRYPAGLTPQLASLRDEHIAAAAPARLPASI